MRSLGIVLVLVVAAVPTAVASPGATVTLAGPSSVDVPGTGTATITVGLQLSDFHCFRDQAFHVGLNLTATGVRATMDSYVATFTVPQGSYAFTPWSGETNLTIHLQSTDAAAGQVDVTATFTSDGGADCLATGGFPEATATLSIATNATAAPTPSTTPTDPTPASSTPATPTDPTPASSTPAAPTDPTPTSTTPASNGTADGGSNPGGSVDALPTGGGYIGDYKATGSSATPGAGVAFAIAGAAGVAILMRRRS